VKVLAGNLSSEETPQLIGSQMEHVEYVRYQVEPKKLSFDNELRIDVQNTKQSNYRRQRS
jgi:hypothetical protein